MPFLFTCPHCQSQTRVDDQYSGQTGECITCGGAIQIPVFMGTNSRDDKSTKSVTWIFAVGALLVILLFLAFSVLQFGGDAVAKLSSNRIRNESIKNLEKIATALNAYAKEYGSYPPPAIKDANGTPLLSWRVLILPYLGPDEKTLYNQVNLRQSWTSGENAGLQYQMPSVFRHPDGKNYYDSSADYYLVVGSGTLFPPNKKPLGPLDIGDKLTQTILVVEGDPDGTSEIWTEPSDLDFANMTGIVNGSAGDIGNLSSDGAAVVTVDGRGHFLGTETPPTTINALITPNGNEPLKDGTLD